MKDYSDNSSSDTIIETSQEESSELEILKELGLIKPHQTQVEISGVKGDMAHKYAAALRFTDVRHLEICNYEGDVDWIYTILQTCPKLQYLETYDTPFLIDAFKTLLSEINKHPNLVSINLENNPHWHDTDAFTVTWNAFLSHNKTLYEGVFRGQSFTKILWANENGTYKIPQKTKLQPYHFNWLQYKHPDAPFWQPHLNNKFLLIGIIAISEELKVPRKFLPSDILKLIISMLDSDFKVRCLQNNIPNPEELNEPQTTTNLVSTTILKTNQQDQLIQDFRDNDTERRGKRCKSISFAICFGLLIIGYILYASLSNEIFKNTDETTKALATVAPLAIPIVVGVLITKSGVPQGIVSSLCPSKQAFEHALDV